MIVLSVLLRCGSWAMFSVGRLCGGVLVGRSCAVARVEGAQVGAFEMEEPRGAVVDLRNWICDLRSCLRGGFVW